MIALIKLILTNLFLNLWGETKALYLRIVDRVKDVILHVWGAVAHTALIPVHAAQWVWGCLAGSVKAVTSAWKK